MFWVTDFGSESVEYVDGVFIYTSPHGKKLKRQTFLNAMRLCQGRKLKLKKRNKENKND